MIMIARRGIISRSAGPIFTIFSPNESILGADDQSGPFFPDISRDVAMATNFVKNGKLPLLIALAFQKGTGYCYLNVRIDSVNDASILCKNFVELTELIGECLVRHGQKTGSI